MDQTTNCGRCGVDCQGAETCTAGVCGRALSPSGASYHTCVRVADGRLFCWGDNRYGQLGDGANMARDHAVPVQAAEGGPLMDVAESATGAWHTCVRLKSHDTLCWGLQTSGEAGQGIVAGNGLWVPTSVPSGGTGILRSSSLALGNRFSCAISTGGEVRCWGFDGGGEMGKAMTNLQTCTGGVLCQAVPVVVPLAAAPPPMELAAGLSHACLRSLDGTVRCWGLPGVGQLGHGSSAGTDCSGTCERDLVQAMEVSGAVSLRSGPQHTCAISGGRAQCWGVQRNGSLGRGTVDASSNTPGTVLASQGEVLEGVTDVAAGTSHTCFLLDSGRVRCAGNNAFGQLGIGTSDGLEHGYPEEVDLLDVVEVTARANSTCARQRSGAVWCWGADGDASLGGGPPGPGVCNGNEACSTSPVQVVGLPP